MLTRWLAALAVSAVFAAGGACSDPDGYPGGGRAQMLPAEGGAAGEADGDAADDGGGGPAGSHDASAEGTGDAASASND